MNEIVHNFLLTGDKFMSGLHLRQPRFTYSDCGPLTKHRERIKKFKETDDLNYICQNKCDKACFAHDAVYAVSKDLLKRTVSE